MFSGIDRDGGGDSDSVSRAEQEEGLEDDWGQHSTEVGTGYLSYQLCHTGSLPVTALSYQLSLVVADLSLILQERAGTKRTGTRLSLVSALSCSARLQSATATLVSCLQLTLRTPNRKCYKDVSKSHYNTAIFKNFPILFQ